MAGGWHVSNKIINENIDICCLPETNLAYDYDHDLFSFNSTNKQQHTTEKWCLVKNLQKSKSDSYSYRNGTKYDVHLFNTNLGQR